MVRMENGVGGECMKEWEVERMVSMEGGEGGECVKSNTIVRQEMA